MKYLIEDKDNFTKEQLEVFEIYGVGQYDSVELVSNDFCDLLGLITEKRSVIVYKIAKKVMVIGPSYV